MDGHDESGSTDPAGQNGNPILEGIAYEIHIDANSAYFDAAERFHLRGKIQNCGTRAIPIGRHHREPNLIGGRIIDATGTPRAGAEASAGISGDRLEPGAHAPFALTLPRFDPSAGDCGVEISLMRDAQYWFCDHGLAAVTIMVASGEPSQPRTEAPENSDKTSSSHAPATADRSLEDEQVPPHGPRALLDYQEARLGGGEHASLDDLWNCYRLFFNRAPDAEGFEYFAALVRQGISYKSLSDLFLSSEEFSPRIIPSNNVEHVIARINGMELYMPIPHTPAERHTLTTGRHKPHLAGVQSSILLENKFIVDIGAGIGEFTTLAAHKTGISGRVVSLEPDPKLMRLLLANITSNKLQNVDVIPFAAADGEGFVSLIKRGTILTTRDVSSEDLLSNTSVVYARTIDSIIPCTQRVDVVKITLDGFDYRAAIGSRTMLQTWKPFFLGEYAPGLLDEFSGISPIHYLEFIKSCGYVHFTAIPQDRGPIDLGDNIGKLADMPARLGTASIDFYASS
jgi:FkbM family methyltransferase